MNHNETKKIKIKKRKIKHYGPGGLGMRLIIVFK